MTSRAQAEVEMSVDASFTELKCVAKVLRSTAVTPRMQRITFAAEEFRTLDRRFVGRGLRMYFAPPGSAAASLPLTGADLRFDDEIESRVFRVYTIRRFDPETHELDVDFVLHDSHGPGSSWAEGASPGEAVPVWITPAPPASRAIEDRLADWYLFGGDETALPHVEAILETIPEDLHAVVLVEVADAAEEQPLRLGPNVHLTWLHRNDAKAGTSGLLEQAVRQLSWPPGRVYTWMAGEAKEMASIRRHLRDERGFTRDDYTVLGYWRLGLDNGARARVEEERAARLLDSGLSFEQMVREIQEHDGED